MGWRGSGSTWAASRACYAVIGGTACDILLSDAGIAFRATKDIDVILLVEERLPEVGRAVWGMVRDGGYTCGWRSSDSTHFYRFTEPTEPGYPSMMQLFVPESSAELPDPIRNDMAEFVAMAEREGVPLAQIGVRMSLDEALSLLREAYGL